MKIIKTKSPRELLQFLEENTYRFLPNELWDENLFFYNKLLKLMSLNVEDELFDQIIMYKIINNNDTCSIALYDIESKTLDFIGDDLIYLNEIISFLINDDILIHNIYLNDDKIASSLIDKQEFHLNYGDKKLYRNTKNEVIMDKPYYIMEITLENAHIYWDWIIGALEEGYRYFGVFENEQLKSRAGLVRISKNRSEIIAVYTISELDRNKGYASFLCNYLVNEALKNSKIVTWTCTYNNNASFRTAEKLGMIHYLSIYSFKYEL